MVGNVEQALADGFRAIKIAWTGALTGSTPTPTRTSRCFAAAATCAARTCPLSFDVNNGYSVPVAIAQGRKMEALGLFHYEEPVTQHDYAGLAQVADALDVPVSAGEHEYTRWQFRDLIQQARVDIVQPDVVKCGGITEMKRIARSPKRSTNSGCPTRRSRRSARPPTCTSAPRF
jgi:D-arabinonate dehydratase/D-galactarolactone cycloisomerase